MSGLLHELKRRNVFKVGMAYVVLAWLIAQVTDVFLEPLGAPEWVIKTILVLLIAGLPLVVLFAWAYELTPEGLKREKDVDRSQSITQHTGQKLNYAIIVILLLALGYFAVDKFVLEPARHPAAAQAAEAATPPPAEPAPREKSIAVLPFVNMSSDPEQEYFSDGISEEILNSLSRVKELQVAGRTSSFAFKGQNQDLRRIGEALGVANILEGSVRKSGATVRITAQLVRADNGFHLWSETYDRELTDVFAIQDEIASAILAQLKAHLLAEDQALVAAARANSEAYDLYLLAKQRMYERMQLPLESAAELLDRAIAIDPAYAPAYAQRGIATLLLSDSSYGDIPNPEAGAQGKGFLEQALRLDPELAEAWAGLGLYHYPRPGELAQGIEALEKALSINPSLVDASNWLHNAYLGVARPAEALAVLEEAIERDPLYRPGVANLVFLYHTMGRLDDAVAITEKARPFFQTDPILFVMNAAVHYARGEIADGLAQAQSALALQPNDRVYRIFYGLGLSATHQDERLASEGYRGQRVPALRRLARVEEASMLAAEVAKDEELFWLLELLNATGRSDEAVAYVEQRWPDLDAFEAVYPPNALDGHRSMVAVAQAYRRVADEAKFGDAMRRVRRAHDALAAQGVANRHFWLHEAAWHAMAGQDERALAFLAAAIDGGVILSARIADDMPYFRDLEGDPDYEAIQSRMIEHLNREREQLGLEPVKA